MRAKWITGLIAAMLLMMLAGIRLINRQPARPAPSIHKSGAGFSVSINADSAELRSRVTEESSVIPPVGGKVVEALPVPTATDDSMLQDWEILLAATNAAEAIARIKILPDVEERNRALFGAAYEIVRTDPVLAMEVAMGLPVSDQGDALIQHVALQWAGEDPQAAAQWAEGLPDDPVKDRVQANIATGWGENDPVRAARYALLAMKPGRAQDDAVVAIVQRWVQTDSEAAADWVSAFPAGRLSETAAENIVKLWTDD